MTRTAIVVGGGIVGRSCALALAARGIAVTMVDGDPGLAAASWGNAGHIAVEQVAPLASRAAIRSAPGRLFLRGGALALPWRQARWWLPFLWRMLRASHPTRFANGQAALTGLMAGAMPAWRRMLADAGAAELLREDGHIVVWMDAAAAARGRAAWALADTGAATIRDLDAGELTQVAGVLARPPAGGIRFDGSGQITDLGRLAAALAKAADAAGVVRVEGMATLRRAGGRAEVVVGGTALPPTDLVLVAAGVRSAGLLAPFGHRVPIVAERGYHIRAADHGWPAGLPPLVFEGRSMIVTGYEGAVQAASFVEPGHADAAPDPAKWVRLERHVAELGLPMRGPFVRWMGSRPTLPDYLPAIGRSGRADNLLYAFGHQHLGLTLAPVTAQIVAALACGETPAVAIDGYDIERFGGRKMRA